MEEMLKRTPDLETPKYDVVAENPGWEVREYADFAVAGASAARVDLGTQDGRAVDAKGGRPIPRGVSSAPRKMAMTTPVFTGAGEEGAPDMMPRYWASGDAEKVAAARSSVTLRLKEGGGLLAETKTVAVVWFGGYAGDEVARRESSCSSACARASGRRSTPTRSRTCCSTTTRSRRRGPGTTRWRPVKRA